MLRTKKLKTEIKTKIKRRKNIDIKRNKEEVLNGENMNEKDDCENNVDDKQRK